MSRLIGLLLLFLACYSTMARDLSPYDFGLSRAKSGVERYEVLMKTHESAIARGCGVTYAGIKQIDLTIPKSAKSIPLSSFTDFAGTVIRVVNKEKDIVLFSFSNKVQPISIKKKNLHKNSFSTYNQLCKGTKLLLIIDETPWVKQRRGYENGVTRKDIILIRDGKADNKVVASYSSSESKPMFYYCDVTNQKLIIKNLYFQRSVDSDHITRLFFFKNTNDVLIKDITINTPNNTGLYGDSAIFFENSTNVKLEDVTIKGTYSLSNKYGYGICLNNVWNSSFNRLKAEGDWGVFGNNNVNLVTIEDSELNRFDIHCYGRDVYCKNTTFKDLYNQFSSFYGILKYENCRFINFVPVLFESSYSAYTYFKLLIDNCSLQVAPNKPYLIYAGNPSLLADNPRSELSAAYWPDISISNLKVTMPAGVKAWYLFQIADNGVPGVYGITDISIEGLELKGETENPVIRLSNKPVLLKNKININIHHSNVTTIDKSE